MTRVESRLFLSPTRVESVKKVKNVRDINGILTACFYEKKKSNQGAL